MTITGISGGGHVTARCQPEVRMRVVRRGGRMCTIYERCDRHGQPASNGKRPASSTFEHTVTRAEVLHYLGLERGDTCTVALSLDGQPQYDCTWRFAARFIDLHATDYRLCWVLVKPPHNWSGWSDRGWPCPPYLLLDPDEERTSPPPHTPFLYLARVDDLRTLDGETPDPPDLPGWCWDWDVTT